MRLAMGPLRRRAVLALACAGLLLAPVRAGAAEGGNEAAAPGGMPSSLPLRRDEARAADATPWLTGTALLGLIAIAGAALAVRRGRWGLLPARSTGADAGRRIERLATQVLTAQASVHAIRWNGEELLVACNAQQVTLLVRKPVAAAEGQQP